MDMTSWSHFVCVGLFSIGLFGFIIRKNAFIILMSTELMLNSANLFLVEVSMQSSTPEGLILFVFVITIAAAETAVGIGLIFNMVRLKRSLFIDLFADLRG